MNVALAIVFVVMVWVVLEFVKFRLYPEYASFIIKQAIRDEMEQRFAKHRTEVLEVIEIYFEQIQERQDLEDELRASAIQHITQQVLIAVHALQAAPDHLQLELSKTLEDLLSTAVTALSQQQRQSVEELIKEIKELKAPA